MDTYEEKYNEALEKAKYYHDRDNIQFLENIFPELKESEDERIRKKLIEVVKGDMVVGGTKDKQLAIAWLKKQGESDETKAKVFLINKGYHIDANGVFPTYEEMYNIIREGLEQQSEQILANSAKTCKDEQKPNPYSGTSFDYDGHTWGMCSRDNGVELLLDGELKAFLSLEKSFIYPIHSQSELAPKSALEATKEEKVDNADKIEPKFKVGKWYQCTKDFFGKGVTFDKNTAYYCAKEGCLQNEYGCHIAIVKDLYDNFKLWTIQDANDGDVLVASDGSIFLFAGVVDCACKYYVALTICNDVKINKEVDGGYWETSRAVHPATKEQRDILFAKMKEAGYEWDNKKKELKKVDSKPIFDVKIPFGAKDSELEEVFYSIPNGFHAEIEDNKVVIKKGEQKSWSEVDNFMYNKIKNLLTDISLAPESINSLFDWLKDLKDRIQPQPKQEWSEEDKRNLNWVINVWNRLRRGGDAQTTPSQMEYLENFLKSLKYRKTWKPSDEQIGALEHFVRSIAESGFASPYDSNTKLVYSLFNDLKKLKL